MLNPLLAAQVKFVIGVLKDTKPHDRAAMFSEVSKVYCLKCGAAKTKDSTLCSHCKV